MLVRALLVLLGGLLLAGAAALALLPRAQGERVEAALEVVGVHDGMSYAWLLRTRHGAALVDTGADASGQRLREELAVQGLGLQDVHTVLLTHGHRDHWAAAHLFPRARVLVGPGEAAVVRGERALTSPAARLLALLEAPPVPARLEEVQGGQTLDVDGESIRVLHVPGHTPGSVVFLWRDLLFSGDALLGRGEGVGAAPGVFSEDRAQSVASLKALVDLPFTRAADGHTGVTANARLKLHAFLE